MTLVSPPRGAFCKGGLFINGTAEPWDFSVFPGPRLREAGGGRGGAGGRRPGVPRLQQVRGCVGGVWGVCGFSGVMDGGPERRDEQGREAAGRREGSAHPGMRPGALGGAAGRGWCQGVAALTRKEI